VRRPDSTTIPTWLGIWTGLQIELLSGAETRQHNNPHLVRDLDWFADGVAVGCGDPTAQQTPIGQPPRSLEVFELPLLGVW